MQTPSFASSERKATGLWRRSSGRLKATAASDDRADEHLLSRIVDVTDDEDDSDSSVGEHTVLLVPHHRQDIERSAILPFAPTFEEPRTRHTWDRSPEVQFSPVPLTPPCPGAYPEGLDDYYPEALSRNPSASEGSVQLVERTPDSENYESRLPTPDYTTTMARFTRPPSSLRSFLPRGLSFASFHIPTTTFLSANPASSCPRSVRSRFSRFSYHSASSTSSTLSVDSGHKSLIPSIGTTSKFTHKWPPPAPMRKVDLHSGGLNEAMGLELSQAIVTAMEEGQGMGEDVQTWTTFKWCLLLSVSSVFAYGAIGLVCAIMTWFRTWDGADVMNVAGNDILVIITLTAAILVFTALVGICGVLLNSRPIVALYAVLMWPALVSILAIGYGSYKRVTFSLDHKLNISWSQYYTPLDRLLVQDSLHCCGFYNPFHESTPSNRCYPRSPLPGCKGKLYRFECDHLATMWSAAFSVALLHIVNIFVALLCANHLTTTFGRGITPKQYRLSAKDVRADADKILRELRSYEDSGPMSDVNRTSSQRGFRED
ncbi:hypothetical protein DXG03_008203 [Asterophora parasitica]|uniref:Tetraspanin Tsp2 n=1 Tax=Asterophora parasitica TaxID=117018 RepID=A0A9P7KBH4_9AGAR|nr:hypothetical protein DXG03_008203 [Asterophora parasitica]